MCGIFAIIPSQANGFTQKEQQIFNDLLYVTALRGTDGTGIMYGTNKGDFQMHKQKGPSLLFMASPEFERSKSELFNCGSWVVGHCRAATRGAHSDENSHPFVIDNKIALVQNGTYNGNHRHIKDVDVDTEAVGHLIADNLDKSDAEILKKINAAYALMWYNFETKQLKVVRNNQRPLYYGKTKSGTVILSSEWGFMKMATSRAGLEFEENPYIIQEHSVGTYTFSNHKKPTEKWEEVDGAYKAPSFRSTNEDYYGGGMGGMDQTNVSNLRKPTVPFKSVRHGGTFKTMGEAALELSSDYQTLLNIPDFQDFFARVKAAKNAKEEFYVEALDYRPVMAGSGNNQYYIYGVIYDNDKFMDGKTVAWTVEVDGNKVDDIINYATSWYNVTLDTAIICKPKDESLGDMGVVLARCEDVKMISNGDKRTYQ